MKNLKISLNASETEELGTCYCSSLDSLQSSCIPFSFSPGFECLYLSIKFLLLGEAIVFKEIHV